MKGSGWDKADVESSFSTLKDEPRISGDQILDPAQLNFGRGLRDIPIGITSFPLSAIAH
jgi:hypothetical protein